MLQCKAEQGALLADHTAGSRGYGQGLGRDHLTHDTTTGVGCTGEDRADAARRAGGSDRLCGLVDAVLQAMATLSGVVSGVASGVVSGVASGVASGVRPR